MCFLFLLGAYGARAAEVSARGTRGGAQWGRPGWADGEAWA